MWSKAQAQAQAQACRGARRFSAPGRCQSLEHPCAHLNPGAAAGTRCGPGSAGVLGIAASLAGIYYVYGGTTTAGFDCSGFTQYVFAQVGISLPRTSQAQQAAATPVSNPQPGDLVFFGYPAGHVGIYAGNGMMWDSPAQRHGRRAAFRLLIQRDLRSLLGAKRLAAVRLRAPG